MSCPEESRTGKNPKFQVPPERPSAQRPARPSAPRPERPRPLAAPSTPGLLAAPGARAGSAESGRGARAERLGRRARGPRPGPRPRRPALARSSPGAPSPRRPSPAPFPCQPPAPRLAPRGGAGLGEGLPPCSAAASPPRAGELLARGAGSPLGSFAGAFPGSPRALPPRLSRAALEASRRPGASEERLPEGPAGPSRGSLSRAASPQARRGATCAAAPLAASGRAAARPLAGRRAARGERCSKRRRLAPRQPPRQAPREVKQSCDRGSRQRRPRPRGARFEGLEALRGAGLARSGAPERRPRPAPRRARRPGSAEGLKLGKGLLPCLPLGRRFAPLG